MSQELRVSNEKIIEIVRTLKQKGLGEEDLKKAALAEIDRQNSVAILTEALKALRELPDEHTMHWCTCCGTGIWIAPCSCDNRRCGRCKDCQHCP